MEIFKFSIIGIIGAICYVFLKKENAEIASLSLIATGLVIVVLLVDYAVTLLDLFKDIAVKTGINGQIFVVVIKTIIISYITEFSKSFCDDVGVTSIGNKVVLAGKICIFIIVAPILYSLIDNLIGLIK